jgi:class 3 adenylate cyclase
VAKTLDLGRSVKHRVYAFGGRRWCKTADTYPGCRGPARAIHCAKEIQARTRPPGVEIRAGVHTGECELVDGKCAGISVTTGARIAALAGPSQILVSQTVKDLVARSGFTLVDAGEQELKRIPQPYRLYTVS